MRVQERARGRMCSFCRAAVDEKAAKRCAALTCGALYHAECWEECSENHGSCAIMGCGSTRVTNAAPAAKAGGLSLFEKLVTVAGVWLGLGGMLLRLAPNVAALPIFFVPLLIVPMAFFFVLFVCHVVAEVRADLAEPDESGSGSGE